MSLAQGQPCAEADENGFVVHNDASAGSSGHANNGLKPGNNDDERLIGFGPFKVKVYVYHTVLIVLINVVLFADMNLLAPVLTPIAREFGFVERYPNGTVMLEFDESLEEWLPKVNAAMRDEKLGGDITFAFFMIGGTVSLIAGYLTDTVNRRNTLALVVVLGETSCLATYFTTTYWGLFVTRALTGVALGGAFPLIFSMFGDLFSVKHRGKAISAAGMALGVGTGVGQVMAGPVAGKDGSNWRIAFVIVAAPAYVLAALLVLTVEEPKRGQMEEAVITHMDNLDISTEAGVYNEKITWLKFKTLLRTPTVLLIFLQGIPGSLPWGIFNMFLSDYLATEKNFDLRVTGLVISALGIGITIGAIIAGILVDKLFQTRPKLIPLILGGVTVFGAFPMAAFVEIPPMSLALTMLYVVPAGVALGFAGNSTKVLLVNITVPETRGTAFSILNLFDDLGRGAGIFFLAKFFSFFTPSPEKTARAKGIQAGFIIGWTLCGFVISLIYFTIEKDYETAQKAVKDTLHVQKSTQSSKKSSGRKSRGVAPYTPPPTK